MARQNIDLCQRREHVNRMAHERCLTCEKMIHRRIRRLYAKEFILSLEGITDAPLETLACRNRRDVIEHHHALIADMPKENTLCERPRDVGMR